MPYRFIPEIPRRLQPLKVSLWLGAGYVALFATYVALSSMVASRMAGDVDRLARLEIAKGVGFVVVTGIGFVLFAYALLGRIATQAKRLEAQRHALLDADRRELACALAAAIAHDVNNVLTIANLRVDEVSEAKDLPEHHRKTLERVATGLDELGKLSHRLLELSAKDQQPAQASSGDAADVIRRAVDLASVHPRVRDCRVTTHVPDGPLRVAAAETALGRALLNLILNAADATEGHGHLEIRAAPAGKFVRIEVHDDGPGIPVELREDVFRPFFTTKWEGTGLGLVSVRALADDTGGRITIGDSPLGGALFVVELPRERLAASA